MTVLTAPGPGAVLRGGEPVRRREPGNVVVRWLTSTDHKVIGYLYLITSFGFFLIGGWMALIMRPSWPGRVTSW